MDDKLEGADYSVDQKCSLSGREHNLSHSPS